MDDSAMAWVRERPTGTAPGRSIGTAAGPPSATVPAAGEQVALDEVDLAAARSDPRAFAAIYERHRLAVYRYVRSRVRSDEEAADLTATVFERAIAGLGSYRARGLGARPWLMTIARNAAVDAARRRRPTVSLDDTAAAQAGDAGPAAVDHDVELLDLVGRLPDVQRDALLLRYAGGLTAAEIGRVIGRRPQAVQKLIERALSALRESYER